MGPALQPRHGGDATAAVPGLSPTRLITDPGGCHAAGACGRAPSVKCGSPSPGEMPGRPAWPELGHRAQPQPGSHSSVLADVVSIPPASAVAVGSGDAVPGPRKALALHRDGQRWTQIPSQVPCTETGLLRWRPDLSLCEVPPIVTVPSVPGLSDSQARGTLANAGLTLGAITLSGNCDAPPGAAIRQNSRRRRRQRQPRQRGGLGGRGPWGGTAAGRQT